MADQTTDLDALRTQIEGLVKKLDTMATDLGMPHDGDVPAGGGTRTILVVEENKDSRDILVRVLEQAGYATISAETETDAFEKLEQVLPSLILLDVRPRTRDGARLQDRLRNNLKLRQIPVVVIAEMGDVVSLRLASAADAVFEKPIDLDGLLETIPDLVG